MDLDNFPRKTGSGSKLLQRPDPAKTFVSGLATLPQAQLFKRFKMKAIKFANPWLSEKRLILNEILKDTQIHFPKRFFFF